tara:strand:- start:1392 stop:2510 length:1119 start_codon:yes stop_codon:yes gene_type:complete
MKRKILVISHDFVKKVNIKIYEKLGLEKNISLMCIRPKKLKINGKNFSKDFKKNDSNIKIIEKSIKFNSLRFLFFSNVIEIIKSFKPKEIIIHNDPISFQVFILIIYSFVFNYSIYCVSNENNIITNKKKFNRSKLARVILLFFLNLIIKNKIKKIFCISKHIKKNYDFLGYRKKTVLLPLGFDEKIFKKKKRKSKEKIFIISYFGRITKDKGIHILLRALEKVKFKFKFFLDVTHVNDHKYYKEILNRFEPILKKSKVKKIKCDYFQISKFMSDSDLVVLPSIYEEQYGRVIQEAVASGSLVIGSDVGAIPEILKDKDLLFKNQHHNELAYKINKLKNRNFYETKINTLYRRIMKERTLEKQLVILKKIFA